MRLTLTLVVALGVGITLGWMLTAEQPSESESAVPVTSIEEAAKLQELEAELLRQEAERRGLERQNQELSAKMEDLLDQLAMLQFALLEVETPISESQEEERSILSEQTESAGEDLARSEARAEENQRRAQARERFEDQLRLALEDQVALLDDPDAAERLDNLLEWRDYQREMRLQYNEAESDEDRNAIREEIEEARYNTRRLVNFEQDSLLQGIASEFGIKASEQEAFLGELRDTLASPYFRMERGLVGGGGGPRGPGPN